MRVTLSRTSPNAQTTHHTNDHTYLLLAALLSGAVPGLLADGSSLRRRVARSSRLSSFFKLAAKASNCASLIVSMVFRWCLTSELTLLAAETGVADGAGYNL